MLPSKEKPKDFSTEQVSGEDEVGEVEHMGLYGPCKQLRRPRALTVSFGMPTHITSTDIQSCVPKPTHRVNGTETEPF
jgi:hypothetical protein